MERQPNDFIPFHFPQFAFLLLFLNDDLEQNSFTQDISQESCQVYRTTNFRSPNNNRETINCFYTSKTQNQRIRNTPRSSDKIHKPSKGILLVTSCYPFISLTKCKQKRFQPQGSSVIQIDHCSNAFSSPDLKLFCGTEILSSTHPLC